MSATIFFDVETGGVEDHHPIVQIAAIAVTPDWSEVETFERKIQFDPRKCDPEALALNSYSSAAWANALPEPRVLQEFGDFLGRHRCVDLVSRAGKPYSVARVAGHNIVGFDLERISAAFKHYRLFFPVDFRTVLDTRYGAVWHFERLGSRPKDFKLTGLCQHFGIPTDGAHDALVDVRLSIALARKLVES